MTSAEFRATIRALGMTQRQLAEKLGLASSTVNRWAKDKIEIPEYAVAYLEAAAGPIADKIQEHALRIAAYREYGQALKSGVLKPQPCADCGTTEKVQGHHDDYSKPLDVVWLCPKHHSARHPQIPYERKPRPTPALSPEVTMTAAELMAWRDRNFGSQLGANKAAAEAIGLTLRAFTMRLYGSQPIGKTVALACAAIDKGPD